jgi:hypothetical protein
MPLWYRLAFSFLSTSAFSIQHSVVLFDLSASGFQIIQLYITCSLNNHWALVANAALVQISIQLSVDKRILCPAFGGSV